MSRPGQPEAIGARGLRALRWSYLGNGVRILSQFVVGVILARLLGPEAFGTVALGGLMVGVGWLVSDLGFGVALVQRPDLTEEDVRFVSTVQVATGALLTVLGVASAPAVAGWFRTPEATPVIRAMSAMFLLQSFGLAPIAMLRRSLDFRGAQLVSVASYLGGYLAVGIPLAWLGAGAWSLVAAQLVQSTLASALALHRHAGSIRPRLRPASPGLFAFGARVVGTNLANWGLANVDGVAIGRLLGTSALGTYGRAMALVLSPVGTLTASLQGVLLAACSRAQAEPARLRRAYLGATSAVAAIALPLFTTVAAVAETVVAGVYGVRWAEAAPILVPLALSMPLLAVLSMVGPVLTAVGRVDVELRVALWVLALLVLALAGAGRVSAVAVAWAVLLAQLVRAALLAHAVRPFVAATWPQLLDALRWPAAWAVATAGLAAAVDAGLRHAPDPVRLLGDVAAAGTGLLACLRWTGRRWLAGLHGDFLRADGRLPPVARRWMKV